MAVEITHNVPDGHVQLIKDAFVDQFGITEQEVLARVKQTQINAIRTVVHRYKQKQAADAVTIPIDLIS